MSGTEIAVLITALAGLVAALATLVTALNGLVKTLVDYLSHRSALRKGAATSHAPHSTEKQVTTQSGAGAKNSHLEALAPPFRLNGRSDKRAGEIRSRVRGCDRRLVRHLAVPDERGSSNGPGRRRPGID